MTGVKEWKDFRKEVREELLKQNKSGYELKGLMRALDEKCNTRKKKVEAAKLQPSEVAEWLVNRPSRRYTRKEVMIYLLDRLSKGDTSVLPDLRNLLKL